MVLRAFGRLLREIYSFVSIHVVGALMVVQSKNAMQMMAEKGIKWELHFINGVGNFIHDADYLFKFLINFY